MQQSLISPLARTLRNRIKVRQLRQSEGALAAADEATDLLMEMKAGEISQTYTTIAAHDFYPLVITAGGSMHKTTKMVLKHWNTVMRSMPYMLHLNSCSLLWLFFSN